MLDMTSITTGDGGEGESSSKAAHLTVMSGLSAADVCAILTSCRKNQVESLRYLGLDVQFRVPQLVQDGPVPLQVSRVPTAKAVRAVEEAGARGLVEAEVALKEDELDLLAIEDPVAYEKFLMSGDAESSSLPSDED